MSYSKYVIFATFWWILATTGNIVRNEDICGPHNGRRLYLELGEKGILYAKNVTFVRNLPRQLMPRLYSTTINSSHHQCSLELVTCPSCVIVVTFKNIALPRHCGDGGVVMDSPCRCDYVWLSEPPYEEVSGSPFCGLYAPITYRSSTRTLSIILLYSQSHKHAFTIEYTAETGNTELIIKEGPTSALMSLEVIRHPASQLQPPRHREHIAPVTSGFHVSLRGTFGSSSHLAIAYAAFSYMDCFAGTDFLCQNHRCIPSQLNCDGFDHCGDNSDEPATCFQNWEVEPRDRKWHMNKANYYFPKIDRYPDLKTATLVFVASSLGLIVLISALIILLYRIGARARQQRELQSRLETISELLDGARIDEISIPDDPPGYEAPPDYEEVAKLALSKKARCLNRNRTFNRSSSNQCDEDVNSSTYLVVEDANSSHSDQTIPVTSENDRHALCIPESPPPPYITPPGTILRNVNLASLSASMKQICPVRRTWLRRSVQYPQSFSGDRPSPGGPASFTNAEAHETASDINRQSENPPEMTRTARETVQEDTTVVLQENTRHVSDEDYDELDVDKVDSLNGRNTSCSCEGACGCAISCSNLQGLSIGDPSTFVTNVEDRQISESQRDQMAIVSSSTRKIDGHQEEDFSISKSALFKLLGSKLTKPSHRGANLTAALSSRDTLRCSSKKFPRDSCINKTISTIGNSCDMLQDDFEIVSEATSSNVESISPRTMASTPSDTPKNITRGHRECYSDRRYSSCDLDSLYEGIKVLDSYLACRNSNVGLEHRQSVTVILFGTPNHKSTCNLIASSQRTRREKYMRTRTWRSSEDASSN